MLEFFGLIGKNVSVGIAALFSGNPGAEIASLLPDPASPPQLIVQPVSPQLNWTTDKTQIIYFKVDPKSNEFAVQATKAINFARVRKDGDRTVIFVKQSRA